MPQIPTVVAPEEVPIPRMSPQIAGEPGQALARTGEALTRTAEYGLQVEEHVRDAQNHLALLTAGNQITAAHNAYLETLSQSGDPDNLPDPEAWKEGLKSQLGADPKYADPRVSRSLETHIDAVGEDARHLTTMRQLTLQRQQEVGQLGELKQTVAFEMAGAPDLDMRGLARGRFETAIAGAVKHGWVTPKEAATELRTLDSTAEDVEIVNAIDKDNPSAIQAMIDKTQNHPELFRHLNPERFAALKKSLRNAYDVAERRQSARDIAAPGDAIIAQYKNDVTLRDPETKEFDALVAAKKLDDDASIPTDVKKYVRTELEQQSAVASKVQNSQFSKLLDHLDPQVESGALTFREITRRENLTPGTPDWIPRPVADHLLSKAASIERENRALATQRRVTASQERSVAAEERRQARQDRMDTSTDLRDELLGQPGHLLTREELTPYRLKGLSPADANIVWQTKNIKGDPGWASAVQIIQKSPAFDLTTTEGRTEQSKFLSGFATRVESKSLTGEQITDALTTALKPLEDEKTKSTVRRFLDWVGQSGGAAVRGAAGVEGVAPTPAQGGRLFKDEPDSYGELGILKRPDGKISSELMTGISDKRLYGGDETNIPLLVKGQKNVDDLLAGKTPTDEQYQIAIDRAIERVKNGETFPHFKTVEEADAAEAKRHAVFDKQTSGEPKSKGKLTDPAIAKSYLQKAGGDKAKARELAKQDGWTF